MYFSEKILYQNHICRYFWNYFMLHRVYEKIRRTQNGQPDKACLKGRRQVDGLGKRGIEVIGMPTDSNWNTLMCGKLTDIEEGNKMNAHLH